MLEMTSQAAPGRHLSRLEKRQKMPHPTAVFALSTYNAVLHYVGSNASSNFAREEYVGNV